MTQTTSEDFGELLEEDSLEAENIRELEGNYDRSGVDEAKNEVYRQAIDLDGNWYDEVKQSLDLVGDFTNTLECYEEQDTTEERLAETALLAQVATKKLEKLSNKAINKAVEDEGVKYGQRISDIHSTVLSEMAMPATVRAVSKADGMIEALEDDHQETFNKYFKNNLARYTVEQQI